MIRPPPRSTRTDTLFPYTTLFRSRRIVLSDLKGIRLPIPDLVEQRRIAAILGKADALRAKRREAIVKLDQLLQSVFLDMFGEPLSNPMKWPKKLLADVASIQTGGRSEEHTSELQSLMRISYAVFCLKKKINIAYHCYTKIRKMIHINYTQ